MKLGYDTCGWLRSVQSSMRIRKVGGPVSWAAITDIQRKVGAGEGLRQPANLMKSRRVSRSETLRYGCYQGTNVKSRNERVPWGQFLTFS